jgi:hypothetical protein
MTSAFSPVGDLEARFEANLVVSRLALEAAMASRGFQVPKASRSRTPGSPSRQRQTTWR